MITAESVGEHMHTCSTVIEFTPNPTRENTSWYKTQNHEVYYDQTVLIISTQNHAQMCGIVVFSSRIFKTMENMNLKILQWWPLLAIRCTYNVRLSDVMRPIFSAFYLKCQFEKLSNRITRLNNAIDLCCKSTIPEMPLCSFHYSHYTVFSHFVHNQIFLFFPLDITPFPIT